jgi:hypothetical protein
MKKALVVLLVSLMVGAFAFAEDPAPAGVTVGGWGRAGYVFATATGSSGTAMTTVFPNWSPGMRVGFNVSGHSANVGFDMNIDSNISAGSSGFGIGDNARIWVKPADFLRFDFGKAQVDNLRGKIGHDWADCLNNAVNEFGDEDAIFKRFYPNAGLVVSLTPVEGLFIGASLDSQTPFGKTSDAIAGIQVGAGYTIKDVGQIRAQYIGNSDTVTGTTYVQAAFALTAIAGLTIDLGAKIPLNTLAALRTTDIILAAAYGADALSLTTRIHLGLNSGTDTNTAIGAFVDGSYTLSGPFAIGAKVGLDMKGATAGAGDNFGIVPYVKLGYSNGYIGLGFAYNIDISTAANASTWSIPIFAEYWF